MHKKEYLKIVFILGLLTAIGPFSIDMYLPGFKGIAKDLHTSIANVSMTLSGYFIGISVGQLLYGPLLDHFGRHKPLLLGMLIYILASLSCTFEKNIDTFIVLRLLQAIGTCSAIVASVAMVTIQAHVLMPCLCQVPVSASTSFSFNYPGWQEDHLPTFACICSG